MCNCKLTLNIRKESNKSNLLSLLLHHFNYFSNKKTFFSESLGVAFVLHKAIRGQVSTYFWQMRCLSVCYDTQYMVCTPFKVNVTEIIVSTQSFYKQPMVTAGKRENTHSQTQKERDVFMYIQKLIHF